MNDNQPQNGVQIPIQDIMKNFAERKAKGDISWDTSGQNPVLVVKVYDISGQEQPEPVKMPFSTRQVEKIRFDFDDQITQRKRQILDLEEQIEALESERDNLYGVLDAELKALAKEKDGKLASAAKGK